ncbi:MAG: protease pro-enzyme activation domain-containing protein [Candidatus Bathyarchaeia archaeon]|jgi:subtilase family serine protease
MKGLVVSLMLLLLAVASVSSVLGASSYVADSSSNAPQPLSGYVLQGQAPGDLPVLVNIAIPLRNEGLLSSMVEQVSDPSSPLFRHFLTHTQIQQEFLPTNACNSMLAYLKSVGLQVVKQSMDSMIIVQANAAQVNQYLGARVNIYSNGTDSYYVTCGGSLFEGAYFVASNATALMVQPHVATSPAPQANANVTFSEGAFSAMALQAVYNATSLYAQGYRGEGQTIGLLEFFGSPTINQDLQLFDAQFGFSNPSFFVTPIVPYNPNLGVSTGWSTEVSLDVELSHAMAPEAAIDMYVTTGAPSFAYDIAQIVGDDTVTTLSMSFSVAPEWQDSVIGGSLFYFNMFLPDQYFMLGSLEGITFLSSTGDGGGSGYSSGPAGNLGNPDNSPYVTAVGGTQTYFYTQPNGSETSVQTAWSSEGYVPNMVNSGGGGGGVSFVEPKPWYQQSQQTPPSYPNGRMEPDLSLQAGVDPGTYIVDSGSVIPVGGTSESVQLLSGLLTLVAESAGGPLGLINPFLYSLGNNAAAYNKAFTPITFGYNIPWTSSYGYNLATGWGSPNLGEIASLYNTQNLQPNLIVSVGVANSTGGSQLEFTPGQTVQVTASIYNGIQFTPITSGSFTASLDTLNGISQVTPMNFNSTIGFWNASFIMGQQSGVAYVNVNGTSVGISGASFAEIFAGYLATFTSPTPIDPWTTAKGLQVNVTSSDLYGKQAPLQPLTMQVNSYSILNNLYSAQGTVTLEPTSVSGVNATEATLTSPYPAGPIDLMLQGSTYGFLPFTNGIYLQTAVMLPEVAVEPGAIAPGQSLTIVVSPVAPVNVAKMTSYDTGATIGSDVASGSNVDALLINPSGQTVASTSLYFQNSEMVGLLTAPSNAVPGLYTILLQANYGSLTLGYTLNGAFYGQVLVSNGTITPEITLSPSTLYMGQTAQVTADIHYPNGQEVTQGEYTAVIYPYELQNKYTAIIYAEYQNFELTPLLYNPMLNRWTANITLPSPYNAGVLSPINNDLLNYAGPYEVYVTGISYVGFPTTTALSAQQAFSIQPYMYLSNQQITTFQQSSGLALSGVNVTTSVNLPNDIFIGSNWFTSGTTIISDSFVNGTIFASGTNLTLWSVQGGNIVALNSSINLVNTNLNSLTLVNSNLSLTSSSYQSISPSSPIIQILSPANDGSYTGNVSGSVTVSGNSIGSIVVYLNYQPIETFGNNGTLSFNVNSANYADGGYSLLIVATQTDGVSSGANSTVYFQNQLNSEISSQQNTLSSLQSQQSQINSLTSSLQSQQSQANGLASSLNSLKSSQAYEQNQINSLGGDLNSLNSSETSLQNQTSSLGNSLNASQAALQNQVSSLKASLNRAYDYAYAGIGIGVAGVAVAAVAILWKRSKSSPLPSPTPEPVSSSKTKETEGETPLKSGT